MHKAKMGILVMALFAVIVMTATAWGATINLPQTGQTKCYDGSNAETSCTGTGQDGEIQAGIPWPNPRFTITYCDASGPCQDQSTDCDSNPSNDVVTDNLTGLMWPRNGNHGSNLWADALTYANNFTMCGYPDWRLPNINEISSLFINAGQSSVAAWLNTQGFSGMPVEAWSSTADAQHTDLVAKTVTDYGVSAAWKTGQFSASEPTIPVRGNSTSLSKTGQTISYAAGDDGDIQAGVAWPSPRFTSGAGAEADCVTDNLTGLMWTGNADYFGGAGTWWNGLSNLKGLSICGHNDWRLPNVLELASLNDYSQWNPALPSGHPFTNGNLYHWSSTTFASNTANAWFGDQTYGGISATFAKSDTAFNRIWPVRGGLFGDLSVTINGNKTTVLEGQNVTYTIHISNSGPSAAKNVTLTAKDNSSPFGQHYVSHDITQGTCSQFGSGGIQCNIGDISSGATVTTTLVLSVDNISLTNNPAQNSVETIANVTSDNDPDTSNNGDFVDIPVNTQLTVSINPTAGGTVTGGKSISCSPSPAAVCSETYDSAQDATLSASAKPGYSFASWSGCDSVVGTQCTVNTATNRTVTANFNQLPVYIGVVSPNGGEAWATGSTQTIRWMYFGNPGAYVKIELLKGGALNKTISSYVSKGTGGAGSKTWTIPAAQTPGTDYKIRITSTSNATYSDTSDATFTITSPPPPSITVTSPNGGEVWSAGTTHTITWTYAGNPGTYVKIELLKGGALNKTIASSAPTGSGGMGSKTWTIPTTQTPGADYSVRVTSMSNAACSDTSNATFTITSPPPPSITVTSPNGGEVWSAGTTHTITWTYAGNPGTYVKIELLKGGVLNRLITSFASIGSGGAGSKSWTIPSTQAHGSDYTIRVTSTTNGAYKDISDANFTIQ